MTQWLTLSASSDHVRGPLHDSHDPSALHASANPDDSDHSEDGSNRPLHRADDPSALLPTDSDVHAGPSTLLSRCSLDPVLAHAARTGRQVVRQNRVQATPG